MKHSLLLIKFLSKKLFPQELGPLHTSVNGNFILKSSMIKNNKNVMLYKVIKDVTHLYNVRLAFPARESIVNLLSKKQMTYTTRFSAGGLEKITIPD